MMRSQIKAKLTCSSHKLGQILLPECTLLDSQPVTHRTRVDGEREVFSTERRMDRPMHLRHLAIRVQRRIPVTEKMAHVICIIKDIGMHLNNWRSLPPSLAQGNRRDPPWKRLRLKFLHAYDRLQVLF